MSSDNTLQFPRTQLAAPAQFSIPLADMPEFTVLPEKRRTEVNFYLLCLERIHNLKGDGSFTKAVETVASLSQHQMRGCSAGSLQRKYYAFLGSVDSQHPNGNWRVLVANYKGSSSLPDEFEQHLKKLAEDNHASMAAAWDKLRDAWKSGEPVPGYGTWVEWFSQTRPAEPLPKRFPNLYPQGWSIRNLYRKAPSRGARTLYQRGVKAAKKFFPTLVRDTSPLRPLELITIDDFELDVKCVFRGDGNQGPQLCYVAGLMALCVGTRRKLAWGLGPRLEREEAGPDGTVRKIRSGIRRLDVQTLIHDIFAKHGKPSYPVTILCENATAAIAPELELALSLIFEGGVRVERTGLIHHKTLTNGFVERGGKPWEKGWIESEFHYLWGRLADLPGYKGSNERLNAPAEFPGAEAYVLRLFGQGARGANLTPEQIQALNLPFLDFTELERTFNFVCERADRRTRHKFNGFARVVEFRLPDSADLQPFQQLALLAPGEQDRAELVERMESAVERFERLTIENPRRPIPPAVLALLLLTPKEVEYRNHAITFAHDKAGYTYVDLQGSVLADVAEGTKFLGYFKPEEPEVLHLADLRGAFRGTLTRFGGKRGMIDVRDKQALAEATTQRQEIVARVEQGLRTRHADTDAARGAMFAHNEAIVAAQQAATAGFSTAEKIAAAGNEAAARAHEQRRREKPVTAESAGTAINDLLE